MNSIKHILKPKLSRFCLTQTDWHLKYRWSLWYFISETFVSLLSHCRSLKRAGQSRCEGPLIGAKLLFAFRHFIKQFFKYPVSFIYYRLEWIKANSCFQAARSTWHAACSWENWNKSNSVRASCCVLRESMNWLKYFVLCKWFLYVILSTLS